MAWDKTHRFISAFLFLATIGTGRSQGTVGLAQTQEAQPRITLQGRALDTPTLLPDRSRLFHVMEEGVPEAGATVAVPVGGRIVAAPLFSDNFETGRDTRWRDVVGTMTVDQGTLVAKDARNEAVIQGLYGDGLRVGVDGDARLQMGILMSFRDPNNFLLAFHAPGSKLAGFHEVVNGVWSPWLSATSTKDVRGQKVHLEVVLDGTRAELTLRDQDGHTFSTHLRRTRAIPEGLVGLYFDTSCGVGPQRFDNVTVSRIDHAVPANAVQVIHPPTCRGDNLILGVNDRVTLQGVETQTRIGNASIRTLRVTRPPSPALRNGQQTLFPTALPSRDWVHFQAEGFREPVCGVIYRLEDIVTCGMALGGVDTGCLDIETSGLWGYCTIFNTHIPRRGPLNLPVLGINVAGKTWVLCDPTQTRQGQGDYQTRLGGKPLPPVSDTLRLEGVKTADQIHYWGHYPVADLEFDTDAPVSVGLRAWSPFFPGDTKDSMIPAIVFEVHIRNTSPEKQEGSVAFSFPGPTPQEAGAGTFQHTKGGLGAACPGVTVASKLASYRLGVIGERNPVRIGGELGGDGKAWARIGKDLPGINDNQPGASVALDFSLDSGKSRVVRFVLTWHAPTWNGVGFNNPEAVPAGYKGQARTFTHMYAKHYPDAVQTAELVARRHEELLGRILAWQQVIYSEDRLPVWLRDSLINVLYMITEDGYWAQKKPPLPDWVRDEDGLFGMNECPRGCPQIECIPCSFYGSLPLAYFFPDLELSTLRGYKGYQFEDGAPTWIFGGCTGGTPPIDFAYPTKGYQFTTNGISLATLVDQFVMCHDGPDGKYLKEFYPMIKKCMIWTVNLRTTPAYTIGERIISMPNNNEGTEWFEAAEPGWSGMTAHVGGLHIAQLRITERMARQIGDVDFARQCSDWIRAAQEAMEKRLWTGSYYLNFHEPDKNITSDLVFGYQLDGEWITDHHALPETLPQERVQTVLETIKRCNIAVTKYGAVNYANAAGTPAAVKGYGTYSYFPPEALMLAMTYMYNGHREFGIELARKVWHNLFCLQGYTWDMPNIMRGDVDTGERTFGNDYYQDMMLWSMPAAIDGQDVGAPTRPGGLVHRVLKASRGQ